MNKKCIVILLVCALSLVCLAGCANNSSTQTDIGSADNAAASSEQEYVEAAVVESDETTEAIAGAVDEGDETTEVVALGNTINLSEYSANSIVTITAAGEYILSGTLADGQIVINVGDEEEVQLVLNNASITNNSGPAILVQNAGKVMITLNDGTQNTIIDGTNYTDVDEDGEPDAAIFSHDDLTINGSGSLNVQANYSDGIESRDDLTISGGNITISAVDNGLFGNNSVEIESAVLAITSGGDTIHSDGDLILESGTLTLSSGDDGIHADGTLTINDGTVNILSSYEGLEATDVIINGGTIDIVASDDGINGAGGNDTDAGDTANTGRPDHFSSSQGSITINGGIITIAAAGSGNGDGLDANGTITIAGGDTVIKTPSSYRDYSDIDYDTSFSLNGGTVRILNANGTYTQVTASNVSNNTGGRR